jgi:hypothetical protein
MLCKGCRVAIQSQIGAIEDEDKLAAMIKLNDELTDTLELYEQALALAVHGSPPVFGSRSDSMVECVGWITWH